MVSITLVEPATKPMAIVSGYLAVATIIGGYAVAKYTEDPSEKAARALKTFNGTGVATLSLHSSQAVSHNTKRLVFKLPEKTPRTGLPLTSSLISIYRPQGCLLPVIRSYAPISDLNKPGTIELLVKNYAGDAGSSPIYNLKEGESLSFASWEGYHWRPNLFSHIYLLAGGMGIAPIYQLINGILQNPEDKTKVTLVFGAKTEEDFVLREELDGFKARFPNRFDVVYTIGLTRDGKYKNYKQGRITEELLREVVKKPEGENVKVFISGPPAMEKALVGEKGILKRLGYAEEQVYSF